METLVSCAQPTREAIACSVIAAGATTDFEVLLTRSAKPPSSHVILSYRESAGAPDLPLPPLAPADLESVVKVPLPAQWRELPEVGEGFGSGYVSIDDPDLGGLVLVGGSELTAPPGDSALCSGGWFAVLRTTGDPEAVTRQYGEQLAQLGHDGEVRETRIGDSTVYATGSDESGAGLFVLESVTRPSGPSYLRVEQCVD